jgi:hypothetical protein
MDDRVMVTSSSRQSLTGIGDGVDSTAVPAPRGGVLAGSSDLHAMRQGRQAVGVEKDHGGGGAWLT